MKLISLAFLIFLFSCSQEKDALKRELRHLKKTHLEQIDILHNQLDSTRKQSTQLTSITDSLRNQLESIYSSDTSCSEDPNLKDIELLNHIFYHMVIKGRSVPHVKKRYGVATMMLDEFIAGLKSYEIFDAIFIENQRVRFSKCAADIESMNFQGDMDLGWEPRSCNFFNFYYYIGTQEPPQYYKTTDFKSNHNKASARIKYFDVYQKKVHFLSKYLEMTYVRESGTWRIQKAELLTEKSP
jgi:hypothetical protein